MSILCDRAANLVEMGLHGLGVGKRHGKRGADPAPGADRAEQIGAFITLVGRLPGPRSAPGPLPYQAVLLPDPGFILKPNLDRSVLRDMGKMGLQRFAEVFLNVSMVSAFCAGWRGRALTCEKPIYFRSLPTVRSW